MASRAWVDWVPPSPKSSDTTPELVPMFGPLPFTPATECRVIHPQGIEPGSVLCCAVCHESGVDHLVRHHTKRGNGLTREGWIPPAPLPVVATEEVGPPRSTMKTDERPQLKGGLG